MTQAVQPRPATLQQVASRGRRLIAYLIDGIAVSVIVSAVASGAVVVLPGLDEPLRIGMPRNVAALLGMTGVSGSLWVLYDTVLHARTGATLGKSIMGIEVRAEDGSLPGLGAALARSVMKFTVSAWVLFLGYLWALWDPRGQAWHDKLVGTVVLSRR